MSDIKKRALAFVNHTGMKMVDFEKKAGLSSGYITSMRKGFGPEKLNNVLSAFPELSRDWLLYGEGSMLCSEKNIPASMQLDTESEATPSISYKKGQPYYDVDFLGGFGEMIEASSSNPEYLINFPPYNKDGVFWCNLSGHSMEPAISHGDIVAMREVVGWQSFLPLGEVYAIITRNEMRTVKVVRKGSSDSKFLLVPYNPAYDAQEIHKEEILRVYKVLGCVKSL